MKKPRATIRATLRRAPCFAGLLLFAPVAYGQENDDWSRHFRFGMQVGLNIKADFSLDRNFSFPISAGLPGVYSDGYVLADNTGDAGGYTSNWGYDNASQFDGNQTLTMHNASSFTYNGPGVTKDDSPYIGFELAYGGNLSSWGRARIGWELGFGMLPINIKDDRALSVQLTETSVAYNTAGIVMPTAPYHGSAAGFGEPTIFDTPTPGGTVAGINGTLTGTRTLDVFLYNIRLGPTLYWPLFEKLAVAANAGFAVGIVSGDYKFDETAVIGSGSTHNTGSFGATDVTYGGTIGATLLYHVVPNGDIYLGAQFLSLGSTTFSGQGRQAKLNLGAGVVLSAGINWPF